MLILASVRRLCPGVHQRHIQRAHELTHLDRLGEVTKETGLHAFFDVARHRVGAQREHRNMRGQRVFGENAQRLDATRSEEHTSELQSLMRISYAVFCLKKKTNTTQQEKK